MPGEEQGHRLVAHLGVGHGIAVFIARVDQQREQIVLRFAVAVAALLSPAGLDDPQDHLVDLACGGLELPVGRRRHPGGRLVPRRQSQDAPKLLHQLGDDLSDVARVGGEIGAKQRLGDDVQRHGHHVLVHVAHLSGPPGRRRPFDGPGHDGGVRLQLPVVECRLQQPALPPPGVTFVDEKAVPHHAREQPAGAILAKGLRLLQEDLLDAGRIGDEVELERQARLDEGAVLAVDERQPLEDAGAELAAHTKEVAPRRSRRARAVTARRRARTCGGRFADCHARSLRGRSPPPGKMGEIVRGPAGLSTNGSPISPPSPRLPRPTNPTSGSLPSYDQEHCERCAISVGAGKRRPLARRGSAG